MLNTDINELFLVLFGKYLSKNTPQAVERWGLTLEPEEGKGNYKLTFFANEGKANVDMEDLEIVSSFFGTSNINIGTKFRKSPCETCQFQSREKLQIFILGSYQNEAAAVFGEGGGILRFKEKARAKYNDYVDQHTCV